MSVDTFSHIVIGAGLGALATLDPAVSSSETLSQAVLIGTVLGSNAPDFDIVYRFRGKGCYYRHHRGESHSLPAQPIWGLALSAAILPFFPGIPFVSLFVWVLLAVVLHVLLDLLNMHGTQLLLPFSRSWIAFDAIPLVDPFILLTHFIGFVLIFWFGSGPIFLIIYAIIFVYLAIRVFSSVLTQRQLKKHFTNAERIKLIPHIRWFRWDVIIETDADFLFGTHSFDSMVVEHTLSKRIHYPELILSSRAHQNVADFLSSTHFAYPFAEKRNAGYFVFWKDLRFRSKKFFPNAAILFFTADQKQQSSYIGMMNSLKQYKNIIKNLKKMTS
ncbi:MULTISPECIES: metal-dependent hydrolase [Mesobacillus]|uniref:Inner membrane protein n=1 Tax=Mesobacillus stamsii TaxID=225347 RepID=A0ABU0FZT2_9BACI|nr:MULTISPECIES: metal-dependent hydrolase [Mesobacillus]MDQ0415445.1 inner membrane protein [Mesobacillus stamsii]